MTYQEQIAAIVAEIAPVLKAGLDAETYATGLIDESDEEDGHYEVRGLDTRTGAPHAFRIG